MSHLLKSLPGNHEFVCSSVCQPYNCSLVWKYRAPQGNMLHCMLADSTAAVRGGGQSKLPALVKVAAVVTGSKQKKDDLLSFTEAMVVILHCSRFTGWFNDGMFSLKKGHCLSDFHWLLQELTVCHDYFICLYERGPCMQTALGSSAAARKM